MTKFLQSIRTILVPALMAAMGSAAADGLPEFNRDPDRARIIADDLERFWAAWDRMADAGERRAELLETHYLQPASPGLQSFMQSRIGDADNLLAAIDEHPAYYASLRELGPRMATAAKRAYPAFRALDQLFPDAVFPDVYLLVGRMNSGGTISMEGLLIGVEMYGLTDATPMEELGDWHRAVLAPPERIEAIIMHELMHFQQAIHGRLDFESLLGNSLKEGAADFLAERVLGSHINQTVHDWAMPREAELWQEFCQVMHGADHEGWLYGGGEQAGRPADLGYFMGYRIALAYHERAADKRQAVRDIITMTDERAFLRDSGYESRFPDCRASG